MCRQAPWLEKEVSRISFAYAKFFLICTLPRLLAPQGTSLWFTNLVGPHGLLVGKAQSLEVGLTLSLLQCCHLWSWQLIIYILKSFPA
jgi:hypothetical protein